MQIRGTIVGASTHTPTEQELQECPRIELTSRNTWDPNKEMFSPSTRTLEDEIENIRGTRSISSVNYTDTTSKYIGAYNPYEKEEYEQAVFDIGDISKRIISGVQIVEPKTDIDMPALKKLQSKRKIRTGITNIHVPPSFISYQWHTYVSPG